MTRTRRPGQPRPRYGPHHRRVRDQLMRAYQPGITLCWRCGAPLTYPRGSRMIHLGHLDSGHGYGGLEHHDCNEAAGARSRARQARGGWDRDRVCDRCRAPFQARAEDQLTCGACRRDPERIASGRPW